MSTRARSSASRSTIWSGPDCPYHVDHARLGQGAPAMSMKADLTNAQLIFGNMGWTKPTGRTATSSSTWRRQEDGSTELQNFKILGDDIDIDGSISLDPEQHLKMLLFLRFLVRLRSPMWRSRRRSATTRCSTIEAHGTELRRQAVLPVVVLCRPVRRGRVAEPADPSASTLRRGIDTVVGFYDTTCATCKSPSRSATAGSLRSMPRASSTAEPVRGHARDEWRHARDQGRGP